MGLQCRFSGCQGCLGFSVRDVSDSGLLKVLGFSSVVCGCFGQSVWACLQCSSMIVDVSHFGFRRAMTRLRCQGFGFRVCELWI